MTATTQVQIYAFDESLVVTTRFQLLQWKHALALEMKGLKISGPQQVSTFLRKKLKTPRGYAIENIHAHIEQSIADIDEQFKSGDFNLEARA